MDYTEIIIEVNTDCVEAATAILSLICSDGFYVEDYSRLISDAAELTHIELIDEQLLNKDRTKAYIHIYIPAQQNPDETLDFVRTMFAKAGIEYKLSLGTVKQTDWANNWKQYYKPINIGKRLLIQPLWEPRIETDRKVLLMDPGTAFGTGTHTTTRLCLEALENYVEKDCSVLDIGTGSGILSIAAMLLGAARVTGVDIDELAVKTARENGKINGFSYPELEILYGDLLNEKISQKYDICCANIVADAIIKLCDNVGGCLKDKGVFISSGIIGFRADEVKAHIENSGFQIEFEYNDEKWACFAARLI